MKFTPADQYHEVSDCGRYTVATTYSNGQAGFHGWRRQKGVAKHLGAFSTPEEARAACENDGEIRIEE